MENFCLLKIVPGNQNTYCQNKQQKVRSSRSYQRSTTRINPWAFLFLIFINDLPDANPKLESYGFADDFKLIAMTNQDLHACAEQLDTWCYKTGMKTNTSKCKLLNIKGNVSTSLNNIKHDTTHVQKDVGLMVTPILT